MESYTWTQWQEANLPWTNSYRMTLLSADLLSQGYCWMINGSSCPQPIANVRSDYGNKIEWEHNFWIPKQLSSQSPFSSLLLWEWYWWGWACDQELKSHFDSQSYTLSLIWRSLLPGQRCLGASHSNSNWNSYYYSAIGSSPVRDHLNPLTLSLPRVPKIKIQDECPNFILKNT